MYDGGSPGPAATLQPTHTVEAPSSGEAGAHAIPERNATNALGSEGAAPESQLGRGCRRKPGLPRRFRDEPPAPPARIPRTRAQPPPQPDHTLENPSNIPQTPAGPAQAGAQNTRKPLERVRTQRNAFGLVREYVGRPSHVPDDKITAEDLLETHDENSNKHTAPESENGPNEDGLDLPPWFAPFESASAYRLMNWMLNGFSTSFQHSQRLVDEVFKAKDFVLEDVSDINIAREAKRLNSDVDGGDRAARATDPGAPLSGTGWIHTSVMIPVPDTGHVHPPGERIEFKVEGLAYKRLIPIIEEAFSKEKASNFHLTPFHHYWQPTPDSPPQRIRDEIYTNDKHCRMHEEVNALPREPDDEEDYERVVVPLMFWSDSTQLANFGNASLWPIYLFFGNESKYSRACPTESSCHHVAYMPKVRTFFVKNIIVS